MKTTVDYERPNTVAGLNAKWKKLTKLLGKAIAEAEQVRSGIKYIEACIMLFDPNAKPPTAYRYEFVQRHTVPKGHLNRFVLTMLQEAVNPLSARQIADTWIIDQMIDRYTEILRLLRKRVGISANNIKHEGLVVVVGIDGESKLWTLEKGGQ